MSRIQSTSQERNSSNTGTTKSFVTVSTHHKSSSTASNNNSKESNKRLTEISKSSIPEKLRKSQEFVELQSCYDDILRNMPDDYMQTVQTLERYLCDLHVSTIFECSSVSDANKTILECLTENALCKEHVLEFCERLLKITDASKLRSMIENLRESVMKSLQEVNLQQKQVNQLPEEMEGIGVLSQFSPPVADLLKKYYHHLLTNMIPDATKHVITHFNSDWLGDSKSLRDLSNKQFLDILIIKTESNCKLFKFCNVIALCMSNLAPKNVTKALKKDLMAVLKCIALSNIPPKHSSNFTAVDLKKSDQEWFEGCKQFSSKGITLLRKYYNEFLQNFAVNIFITLEKFYELHIADRDETLNRFMLCSSLQECNKEILHFLIESSMNDNQLLGFSFLIQALTGESNVAALFRDDCLEMLMEKATCEIPQQEVSTLFPFTCSATSDIVADDINVDHQQANTSSLDVISELSTDNSIPTHKELYEKITLNFAAHWKIIGICLGIPNGELDAIEYDFLRNCQECCNRMLAKWLDIDTTASWKKICDAVNLAVPRHDNPCKRTNLPPPTLPANFIPRPQLMQKISTALMKTNITFTNEVTVTIRGIGGIGKSTIAKALCYEQSIKEYFTGGFLWITLTPPHNVTDELCKIYNKLTNQPIEGIQSSIKDKIQSYLTSDSSKLLVILDDVWEAEDALVYTEVFRSYKILLTTQKSKINSEIHSKNPFDIKPMESDEAVELLTRHIDGFKTLDDNDEAMLHKLAEDLHCWPLLLSLVRTQLYIYCTENKMSPRKAILLANQKLCKSFTAFDKTSREKAVKICLDTSLTLLPEQSIRLLRCIVLTVGGFGSYAIKDAVVTVSKMTAEEFSTCEFNLWSHGLIESIDIPVYSINQCISCIGVHSIIAHYITETLPLEYLQDLGHISVLLGGLEDFLVVYFPEENAFVGTTLQFFVLSVMLMGIRVISIFTCLFQKAIHFNTMPHEIVKNLKLTADQPVIENMYSTINKDCALYVSLITNNKHDDAIEWLKVHFKGHPLSVKLDVNFSPFGKHTLLEIMLNQLLIPFTLLHKCTTVLMKVKTSKEDLKFIFYSCCNCFLNVHS